MLYITMGTRKDAIDLVSNYFDAVYEPEWLNADFAKQAIRIIDKSEHIQDDFIKDYQGYGMSAEGLSSGCKALILLYNMPELTICGERLGDNCFPLLFDLADSQDIHITLSHYPKLTEPFTCVITNTGKTVSTVKGFANEFLDCCEKELISYD